MKFRNLITLSIVLLFIGCSTDEKKINLDAKPEKQIPLKSKKISKIHKGTLYSRAGASLFADKKDLQIGDILQVNINETLKNDSKNSRALTNSNTSALGGGIFTPANGVTNTTGTAARIAKLNNALGIGFSSTSSSSFNGSASSKFDEKFSTIISVVIMEIYRNGNYFIKGNKKLLINNQEQQIGISGVIRPYDISPENTVLSSQIANLKILYDKEGEEADSLEKPWGTKLLEVIWPF